MLSMKQRTFLHIIYAETKVILEKITKYFDEWFKPQEQYYECARRWKQMTNNKNSNNALSQLKYEVANDLNINLKQGYNGDLTSKQAGSIGGEMVKRLIMKAENQMSGNA